MKGSGKRYNLGKTRIDLNPPHAVQKIAEVFTFGADKYGERNWEMGMKWSNIIASLERHLNAIKRGEDFDKESGLLHAAHLGCNVMMLLEYYTTYPEGDDRAFPLQRRIGLDIDDVLAAWVRHWTTYHDQEVPASWNFDREISKKFDELKDNKEFWMSIPPKVWPKDIPFEPTCYVTSRPIPTEWTEEWLDKHGYPAVPVYTVGLDKSKVEVCKEQRLDIFVDDRYENFRELTEAGIFCYLFDAPHNQRYDVGHRRIFDLNILR